MSTIDIDTAAATLVNRCSVLLTGTSFGVDFNRAADRLRIVSGIGQNLRHNVNVGGVWITVSIERIRSPASAIARFKATVVDIAVPLNP